MSLLEELDYYCEAADDLVLETDEHHYHEQETDLSVIRWYKIRTLFNEVVGCLKEERITDDYVIDYKYLRPDFRRCGE